MWSAGSPEKPNDISSLKPTERRKTLLVAGYVVAVRTMITKRGTKMAIVKIEDRASNIEMAVFSEVYEDARPLLVKDQLLIVDGEVSVDEFTGGLRLSARRILDLAMARNEYAKYLCIHAIDQSQVTHTIGELKALLQRFRHGN